MKEFIDTYKQLFEIMIENKEMVICVVVTIAVFVFEMVLVYKGKLNFGRSTKKMEKAKAMNHVIKANRIRYSHDSASHRADSEATGLYEADYEYEINGRKKKYGYVDQHFPPMVLELYYIDNPNRVFRQKEGVSGLVIILYIIPIAVLTLLILWLKPQV